MDYINEYSQFNLTLNVIKACLVCLKYSTRLEFCDKITSNLSYTNPIRKELLIFIDRLNNKKNSRRVMIEEIFNDNNL